VALASTTLTLIAVPAAAGEEGPAAATAPHHIPRLEAQIDLDGMLEERAWSEAWTWELSFEVERGLFTPARGCSILGQRSRAPPSHLGVEWTKC
jgi:hypothetical protein